MEIEFGGQDTNIIATIPPVHVSWKPIVIRDDGAEVTVFYGDFTHDHYKYYGEDVQLKTKALAIAEDVVEELARVFDDQIEFYRARCSSGMRPIGLPRTALEVRSGTNFKLWSGKDSP